MSANAISWVLFCLGCFLSGAGHYVIGPILVFASFYVEAAVAEKQE